MNINSDATFSIALDAKAIQQFYTNAQHWAFSFNEVALYNSHDFKLDIYSKFNWLIAVNAIDTFSTKQSISALQDFDDFCNKNKNHFLAGYFSYDIKNNIEKLSSQNIDSKKFPDIAFFVPEIIIYYTQQTLYIQHNNKIEAEKLFHFINNNNHTHSKKDFYNTDINLQCSTSKDIYINDVKALQQSIIEGTVYEINYCIEYNGLINNLDCESVFTSLCKYTEAPFGAYFKFNKYHILCASPERYIQKSGKQLISQPIKGTSKKGLSDTENRLLQKQLLHSEKERAENVMIVDLVRNDLCKCAVSGSVTVPELFGVYEFKTVHHLISTISCHVKPDIKLKQIIENTFPMGSMTGAPKYNALQLIDDFEKVQRGPFSGSLGYILPNGDFDFNVIIRSLFYNENSKALSLQTGSAITIDAVPEYEYEECLLKANALLNALKK